MKPLPLWVDGRRLRALVVGGGRVAERKVRALCTAGVRPVVVAPELSPRLAALAARGAIEHRPRPYAEGDAQGFQLVIAATDRRDVNDRVRRDAEAAGAWVNVADDPRGSTVLWPAVVRRGAVVVAIGTGGASPLLARRLRERVEQALPPGVAWLAARLRRLRVEVRRRWPSDPARRRAVWACAVPPEMLDWAARDERERIEAHIAACLSPCAD